jgi:hypothetical protein
MEYGKIIGESYRYMKEGVFGRWERWLLLLMSIVVFPFILGYIARIYRGDTPAPRFEEGGLFLIGLKMLFAALIYAIPVIAVLAVTIIYAVVNFMPALMAGGDPVSFAMTNPDQFVGVLLGVAAGLIVTIIIGIIITLISTIGLIRFAKTGSFSEAFNFSAIFGTIRAIGWGTYIVAMIIYWVIGMVIFGVLELLNLIPTVGWVLYWIAYLIIIVPYIIFAAKYVTLVYESAKEPVSGESTDIPE